MIKAYVIPYNPHMFVQLRMESHEALELADELEALKVPKSARLNELLERLKESASRAAQLKKKKEEK